ncbi:MAG: DUF167 family protein [Rhodospirillales bacterium]
MTQSPSPLTPFPGGVRLSVRLTPKASAERLGGVVAGADGRPALKARVSAPPEDGKANAALLKLLARRSRLPPSSFSIVSGHARRTKLVAVAGDPADLLRRLERILEEKA